MPGPYGTCLVWVVCIVNLAIPNGFASTPVAPAGAARAHTSMAAPTSIHRAKPTRLPIPITLVPEGRFAFRERAEVRSRRLLRLCSVIRHSARRAGDVVDGGGVRAILEAELRPEGIAARRTGSGNSDAGRVIGDRLTVDLAVVGQVQRSDGRNECFQREVRAVGPRLDQGDRRVELFTEGLGV